MSSNPLNLALRFILEIAALFALGYWGWAQHEGVWQFVWSFDGRPGSSDLGYYILYGFWL